MAGPDPDSEGCALPERACGVREAAVRACAGADGRESAARGARIGDQSQYLAQTDRRTGTRSRPLRSTDLIEWPNKRLGPCQPSCCKRQTMFARETTHHNRTTKRREKIV